MIEPSLALQGAIFTTLNALPSLDERVVDRVQPGTPRPYARIGDDQVIPQPADCFERSVQIYVTIHVFSSAAGKPEAKTIAGEIVDALDQAELDLAPDWTLGDLLHDGTRYLDEPDGLSTHAVVTFRATLDPA